MTCDECKALLLALVEGDLPQEQADEVRRTAAECPECQQELDQLQTAMRLASELPAAPVPAGMHARLMTLAHAEAREAPARPASPVQGRVSESGIVRGWLHFVERFANGPQFGMATIMVLLAVGTLWVLPNLPGRPEGAGDSVATVEAPAGTLADEEALAPAEELDLAVDMRRGRLRRRGDVAARPGAAPRTEAPDASERLAQASETKARSVFESPAAPEPPARRAGDAEGMEQADQAVGSLANAGPGDVAGVGAGNVADSEAAKDAAPSTAATQSPIAKSKASADAPNAEPAWKPVLDRARKLQADERHAEAAAVYDELIARKDVPPAETRALIREAIRCHEQLGNAARVAALRELLPPAPSKKRSKVKRARKAAPEAPQDLKQAF